MPKFMDTTNYKEMFIEAMVEAQEFVLELNVTNCSTGYDDMVEHPFTQNEEGKLNDLFHSKIAEDAEITEDMIVIVLSDYYRGINKRLRKELLDDA